MTRRTLAFYRSWRGLFGAAVVGSSIIATVLAFLGSPGAAMAFVSLAVAGILVLVASVPLDHAQPASRTDEPDRPQAKPVTDALSPPPGSAPLVSIVVAARNEARYIDTCLASIRTQTWKSFECIVIDDGSTDDTLSRAFDHFADDSRFRFVANDIPRGLAAVRNQGIDASRGRYVTFVDGDDALYPAAIETRLSHLLVKVETDRSTAGVYCDWSAVPQSFEFARNPDRAPNRSRPTATWLSALEDAPFIASAPLLRLDVVRTLGGFKEDLVTAEDAEFWNRLLRNGYTIEYVPYVGIAYRQKQRSMFRDTAGVHAATIAANVAGNFESADPSIFVDTAPYRFVRPAGDYVAESTQFRRLVTALAIAIERGDADAITRAEAATNEAYAPYLSTIAGSDDAIRASARRAVSHRTDVGAALPEAEKELRAVLSRVIAQATAEAPPSSLRSETFPPASDSPAPRALNEVDRIAVPTESDPGFLKRGIALVANAPYHVDELGPLAETLQGRGVPATILVPKMRWTAVQRELRKYDVPVFELGDPGPWISDAAGLVVMNDWGLHTRGLVELATETGVPTFGKVEGVQDFGDADVDWQRNAYRTVDHVLAQGRNDVNALPGCDTHIVGSTRLERIRLQPSTCDPSGPVVVNVNFTFGVLEDARDSWVTGVVEACETLGLDYVLSLHPAEKQRDWPGFTVSDDPIRYLLEGASTLVSRFSTVPFEAMARGVPFVYHNPHQELVPSFHVPDDAFMMTDTIDELVSALREAREWVAGYRERSRTFFDSQIDINPAQPPELRAAEAIALIANS